MRAARGGWNSPNGRVRRGGRTHRASDPPEIGHADLEVSAPRQHPPARAIRDELERGRQLAERDFVGLLHVGDVAAERDEAPAHIDLVRPVTHDASERRERAQRLAAWEVGARRVVHEPVADAHPHERCAPAMTELREAAGHAALHVTARDDADPRTRLHDGPPDPEIAVEDQAIRPVGQILSAGFDVSRGAAPGCPRGRAIRATAWSGIAADAR